jgi:glycosyltransferase involved in cell wall biosynthesis
MTHEFGSWKPGSAPVAVVMISLNEGHNMRQVLENLSGWAQQVFLVDSCSADETVSIALSYGVHVVQRKFVGFGDQWNFALEEMPISAPWTMKLDPDERLTDELKSSLEVAMRANDAEGLIVSRRLWFMGTVLPICQPILRAWKTGKCRFTDVSVNEHPIVLGRVLNVDGYLEHHDSPGLDHWLTKQNRYTSAEAVNQFTGRALAAEPKLLGTPLERRMWWKTNFWRLPGRYLLLFFYHLIFLGAWRAGKVGWAWARLRTEVYRLWEYKNLEFQVLGYVPEEVMTQKGQPDPRVRCYT